MINFYGGEPLLNKEVLIKSLEYIDSLQSHGILPSDLRISLVTIGFNPLLESKNFRLNNMVAVNIL